MARSSTKGKMMSSTESWKWSLNLAVVLLHCLLQSNYMTSGARMQLEGPSLVFQPNPVTYFSNSLGVTISCLGKGHAPLMISWLTVNGDPLPQLPGLREILQNESLYFPPFRPEEYSPETHNGQLRCSVSNPVGTLISSIFSVRAVVDSPFDLFITGNEDTDIIENNPTVLQCNLSPSSYSEFVQILTWKLVDQFGYQSEVVSDGIRYHITPKKSLVIFSVKQQQQLFVCIAQNTLTRKTQSSSPFLVKATKGVAVGGIAPKSFGKSGQIILTKVGKAVDLICPVVGSPPPSFLWEKSLPNRVQVPVVTSTGVSVHGPVLSFTSVELSQNGSYRCETVNSFGSASNEIHLTVATTPNLMIEPKKKLLLRLGNSVELLCRISPILYQSAEITWTRNGKVILNQGSRIKLSGNKLMIFSAQWEDQGIYQCFAQIEGEYFQASTSLFFEASEPELLQTFITQSLQPGPSISLKCSATGNPVPTIQWFVDGQELLPNVIQDDPLEVRFWQVSDRYSIGSFRSYNNEIVSHINISTVRVEDSGLYECRASNYLGHVSHSARLNIYGPLFVKEMTALTLVAEEVALIPCLYGGYPVDKIVWKKNSQELAMTKESRFSVLSNGTLMVEKINRETDKGQYQCVISNRKGETAFGDIIVNVMHPPVISPFNFDDNLIQGQRTSVTCNVISGDLPIEIVWMKDYQVVPKFLNIVETRVKFLSYLIFEELRKDHSGSYTCSAKNDAATRNHSTILDVKVPPYWIHEPQDAKVILRGSHVLQCEAGAVPSPTVKWFRDTGIMKQPILNDHKFELLDDGGLKIDNIEAMDSSNYVCQVQNGVGTNLAKSVYLHVNIPAKVSAPMTSIIVAEGLETVLKCQIRGEHPIQVNWRKNSLVIKDENNPRLQQESLADNNSSIISVLLRIGQAERSDSGIYECLASNQFGRDSGKISLDVKARPSTPEDFIVEEIGSRFIRLRWSSGPQTSSTIPVTYFMIQFKKSSELSWSNHALNTTIQAPATHAVIEPLHPVTHYDIRIFASNEIGHSFPTEPLAVLTLSEAPSGPPLNVSAIPLSSKSILVKWNPPDPLFQHGTILGYHIFASPLLQNAHGSNNSVVVDEKWSHQAEVTGLKPNLQYRITVRAYNSAGMGPEAPFVAVKLPEGAPESAPTSVHCSALSPRSLQVDWNPPAFEASNGQLQGFKVVYQSVEDERLGEKPEVKKTSNRETTLHGLQSYTNYSVRTLAFTVGGEGPISMPIYCMTEEDVPDETADIKVAPTSTSSVLVSWLPPLIPNGLITKYTIYWTSEDKDGIKEKSYTTNPNSNEQVSEVRRLSPNLKYTFWVVASTSAGPGKLSKLQNVVITSKVSSRIVSFPTVVSALIDQPALLPCKAVGLPPPKILWIKKNSGETSHHLFQNGSLFISHIKDSDEGTYVCRAENSYGNDEIQHRLVISRPPSAVQVFLGYISSSSIQVHWENSLQSDPPISGYTLSFRKSRRNPDSSQKNLANWEKKRLSAKLSSYTIDSLKCGTPYELKLAAENSIGLGPFSALLQTGTNGASPSENIRLTDVIDGNETVISINLGRWPDGGCPVTHFLVEYKLAGSVSTTWQRIFHRDNYTKLLTFSTVSKGKYDLKIRVENDAGYIVKTFQVEADTEFFISYSKLVKESNSEESTTSSLLMDPHVFVPILSAIICTAAITFCIIALLKKRSTSDKGEWKFGQSSSQQTWLSSEESHGNCDANSRATGQNMSIYATLNSTKQIPMEIRDSTVRFQTFGQRDNYDPAPPISTNSKKSKRRKSTSSSISASKLDGSRFIQEHVSYQNHYEPRNTRFCEHNSDSDDTDYATDYARPYQHLPARIPEKLTSGASNTLKKKPVSASRSRGGSREYLD